MDRLVCSGMNFHQRRTHPHSYGGEQKADPRRPFALRILDATVRTALERHRAQWRRDLFEEIEVEKTKGKEGKRNGGERRANICCTQAPAKGTLLQCFSPLFIAADCEYAPFEHDVSLK